MQKNKILHKFIIVTLIIFMLSLGACGKKAVSSIEENVKSDIISYSITESLDSKAIKNNKIHESSTRSLDIYLPASYDNSEKSYPVVYYLHGFTERPGLLVYDQKNKLDMQLESSEKEFILVEVDGYTSNGGSFYVNSSSIGNWEDYTVKEVVDFIDNNYRTIATPESRGLCGYAMGGFASLNLALLHPDVYGAAYAINPAVVNDDNAVDAFEKLNSVGQFSLAYAQAFSPISEKPYGKIPAYNNTQDDNIIVEQWENGFGNWDNKISEYKKLNSQLNMICIAYGKNDQWDFIRDGSKYLSDLLTSNEIENSLIPFDGDHDLPQDFIENQMIPYFNQYLVY